MSKDEGYNGWTNYETWCVHLWLSNEEGSYRYWREEAERHRKEAPHAFRVHWGIVTVEREACFSLAGAMKESFETFHPFRGEHLKAAREPDVFCDLLDAALSEVNWDEIAEAFLEELEPTEHDQEEPEDGERIENPKGPLFELGRIVSTPGALETLDAEAVADALARHHRGDWGEIDREDWQENETSLREGFRLFSVYRSKEGVTFWVITEADRSATTVLLPSEY